MHQNMDLHCNEDGLLWDAAIPSNNNVLAALPVKYATLFAKAPAMMDVLEAIFNDCDEFLNDELDISPSDLIASIRSAAEKFLDPTP